MMIKSRYMVGVGYVIYVGERGENVCQGLVENLRRPGFLAELGVSGCITLKLV
jgi:hypothetical protein